MKTASELLADKSTQEAWISLLDAATREVFDLMLGCKLAAPQTSTPTALNVTSMVGLAGQLCGVLSVSCTDRAAALMASKMLGVDPDSVGAEASDAVGEVSNMVAGNFKNKIAGLSDGCMLSPPTVVTGTEHDSSSLADPPGFEVRLLFEGMPLLISLQINSCAQINS